MYARALLLLAAISVSTAASPSRLEDLDAQFQKAYRVSEKSLGAESFYLCAGVDKKDKDVEEKYHFFRENGTYLNSVHFRDAVEVGRRYQSFAINSGGELASTTPLMSDGIIRAYRGAEPETLDKGLVRFRQLDTVTLVGKKTKVVGLPWERHVETQSLIVCRKMRLSKKP